MMRIVFDIDGVLADFLAAFTPHVESVLAESVVSEADRKDHLRSILMANGRSKWPEHQYVQEESVRRMMRTKYMPALSPLNFNGLDMCGLAAKCIGVHGPDKIRFLTSRAPEMHGESYPEAYDHTLEWLQRLVHPVVSPSALIFNKAYDKGFYCRSLGANVMVEDTPDECYRIEKTSPNTKILLLAHPFNARVSPTGQIKLATPEDLRLLAPD